MESDELTLSLDQIKKRAVKSFFSLTARQVALRAISFISINVILAKILPVETLGIFNIATAIITFFAFFSDIGLAASLIQKKENITKEDIKTTFTIQLLIVSFLSLIIFLSADLIGQFYRLDNEGVWLVRILGIGFFLSSLKVIPSVMLERQLNFSPLVLVEVVETLIFNGLLILLVLNGLNIWGFSIAVLARGVIGVILIYIVAPVKVGIGIEKQTAKKLLSFGIPFQANSLLALTKDRLVPLIIAKMVGPVGVGYITWAQALAWLPLEFMNIVIRISFPTFSRLQHDKKSLSTAIEKSLFVTTLVVYPLIFGFAAILPAVVSYVVSPKWQPAIPSFYLFAFATLFSVISTVFTNALNAIGQIKTTMKLMVFWTVLTWILTPALVYYYGFLGVALTSFIISFTSILAIILIKKTLTLKVIDSITLPLVGSIVMFGITFAFSTFFVKDKLSLAAVIMMGGLIYFIIIYFFGGKRVIKDLKGLKNG